MRVFVNVVLVALILAGAHAVYNYLKSTRPEAPQKAAIELVRAVEAVPLHIGTYRPTMFLYGQIAARRSVDLRVLVSGEVTAIADGLRNGGKVSVGEALVVVDRFEYDGAFVRSKAELAETEARVAETRARIGLERAALTRAVEQRNIAEREYKRVSTLERRGAASVALVDASRLRLSTATSTAEIRENQVKILQAQLARETASLDRLRWNVSKAERDIENTKLIAPFSGTISNPTAEVGRLVNVNDRIATLIDTSEYDVRFTLSDSQYGRLSMAKARLIGRDVTIRWQAGNVEIVAKGTIERISPIVSVGSGGFDVYARLEASPETRFIRPGAFVNVEVGDIVYDNVARIPQSAVHPGNQVFVIGSDNRLVAVKVKIAAYEGDFVLVSGNLDSRALVMATRLPDAGPGTLVSATVKKAGH